MAISEANAVFVLSLLLLKIKIDLSQGATFRPCVRRPDERSGFLFGRPYIMSTFAKQFLAVCMALAKTRGHCQNNYLARPALNNTVYFARGQNKIDLEIIAQI
jgi:hypothetical protein